MRRSFGVAVQDRDAPFMTKLRDMMVKSTDSLLRQHATLGLGSADTAALAETAVQLAFSNDVQPIEMAFMVIATTRQPEARATTVNFVEKNFQRVTHALPGFARPAIIRIFEGYCAAGDVERVDPFMKPKLAALGGGELALERAKERIRQCVALKTAKSGEIGIALSKAAATH
jgi:hypothetical protein